MVYGGSEGAERRRDHERDDDVTLNGRAAHTEDFVLFRRAGERIAIEASSEAHLLVLNGEPIAEPVVQYGPFVMNTEREIRQGDA